MSRTTKQTRPELEANYLGVLRIFEQLENARQDIVSARRCADPSDAIYYRDGLDRLVRLEAQVDALTFAFQKTREELKQWLHETEKYFKALEKSSGAKV